MILFLLIFMINVTILIWNGQFSNFKRVMFLALHLMESISQLIRFARASRQVADFNTRIKLLTQKLLKQDYWYHKFRKTFF